MLTYNRPESLRRLLKSLAEADYDGDAAALEIWYFTDRYFTRELCKRC